ncbi:MAG: hypothetical protein ABSA21_13660 [Candidatus Limnocylindrales bacterium]
MVNRGCTFEMPDGPACRAPALRGKSVCYWHDPDKADEAAEARRIGGLHRRKAKSVATIYDFAGLRTVESAQRLLETAAIETLALENSISRNRTLISAASGAGKLIEAGELDARLAAVEAAVGSKPDSDGDAFPGEPRR